MPVVSFSNINTMDRISIVFCSDDAFAQHTAVTMRSLLEHCSRPADIDFYYIHNDISDAKQTLVRQSIEGFGATLTFLSPDVSAFNGAFVNHYYSLATYFRFLIPVCLPSTVDRCLYLDGDMIVDGDIVELWETDLNNLPLGAVPDLGVMLSPKRTRQKQTELNIPPEAGYFNAGMLLIDLGAWRREGYAEQAARIALSRNLRSHDQDALNIVFSGRWQAVNYRWNKMPAVYGLSLKLLLHAQANRDAIRARTQPGILHYASRHKPWKSKETMGFNEAYYETLRKTAFACTCKTSDSPVALSERLRILLGKLLYTPFL